jgi:hypothetical protein
MPHADNIKGVAASANSDISSLTELDSDDENLNLDNTQYGQREVCSSISILQ